MKKKIVVTGALGHIGSALIRQLSIRFPNSVIIMLDNLATMRFCSLFNLPRNSEFYFHQIDVTESRDLNNLINGANYVIHLAAITDAASSFDNRSEVERVNYQATARVAEACINAGAKMIHLSSTSVYGSQSSRVDETCREEDLRPQSPYAETKLREEKLIADLVCNRNLRALTYRFGTIFGWSIGMRFHTAVNKFCWQAVMNQPLTVWSTAFDQKRPYLGIHDACAAICHAIEADLFDGCIYNVVSENATVRDVIDEIRTYVHDLKVNFVDSPIMNQLSYEVSSERLSTTGFMPNEKIADGIRETINALGGLSSLQHAH